MIRLPFLLTCFGPGIGSVRCSRGVLVAVPIDVNVIVDIDVYVIVAAATDPDPAVSSNPHTPAVPVAVIGDDCAHGHADAESNERCIGIVNRVIDAIRVGWDVNHLRVRRLDLHDLVGDGDDLGHVRNQRDQVGYRHHLLRRSFQGA